MPTEHAWRQSTQPESLVRQVCDSLQRDELVILPTEIGPMVAGRWSTRSNDLPATTKMYRGIASVEHLGEYSTAFERAWCDRLWPNPLAVKLAAEQDIFWQPSHPFTYQVLQRLSPLALIPVAEYPRALVSLNITDTQIQPCELTIVHLADRCWEITQQGQISAEFIRQRLTRSILFVCTGNTCRSPMAEALFKHELAQRLGCQPVDLVAKGYSVRSVGTSAAVNDRPTAAAVDVLVQWGIDHSAHRSQPARMDVIATADDIIGMTRSHLLAVLSQSPYIRGSLRLLCGQDGDLADPIGGGADVYQSCAETIRRHVNRLITEMGLT